VRSRRFCVRNFTVVADLDGDGKIFIENLFGDEITFKRKTGFPAFHFAVDRARRTE
jgi:hypothetical protein